MQSFIVQSTTVYCCDPEHISLQRLRHGPVPTMLNVMPPNFFNCNKLVPFSLSTFVDVPWFDVLPDDNANEEFDNFSLSFSLSRFSRSIFSDLHSNSTQLL